MSPRSLRSLLAISLACVVWTGCGGSNEAIVLSPADGDSSLALHVWEESFLGGHRSGSFALLTTAQDGEVIARVKAVGALNLKALYFDLAYDASQVEPQLAEATAVFCQPEKLLSLTALDRPGVVYFGAVMVHPDDQAGFSGDGVLAEVRFARNGRGETPMTPRRQVTAAPSSSGSRAPLRWDPGTNTLHWYYYNQGDYDQNGEVNIADLTPLGADFGARPPQGAAGFPEVLALAGVDGDGNGEINIADITPIGANLGRSALGGYEVYSSTNMDDYPASNDEAPSIAPIGTQPLPGMTPQDQRLNYAYTVAAPQPGDLHWVRPIDGEGGVGTPSNMTGGSPGDRATLSLDNPPSLGAGTEASPYITYPGDVFNFSLYDAALNDVTHSADTEYHVSVGAADTIPTAEAGMRVLSDFSGTFAVWAVYENVQANNVIWFRTPTAAELPVAVLTASVSVGPRPLMVDFDASGSYDPDGNIVNYEFEWTGPYNGWSWFNSGGTAQQQFVYDASLDFECWLRVTDNDGLVATTSIPVIVYEKSATTAFQGDPATSVVGKYCSLAEVNDQPGISHYDETAGLLLYTYHIQPPAPDPDYWETCVVDDVPVVGKGSSLVPNEDYTLPYIAYYDQTNHALKFARATTAEPTGPADWTVHTVDAGPDVGMGPSLWQVDGFPMIAYEDAGSDMIKFAQSAVKEPSSSADWAIHSVAPVNNPYSAPCLRDMGGLPACSYFDPDTFRLMYARSTTLNPVSSADWQVMVAEESVAVGGSHSLASVYHYLGGGNEEYTPALSYYNATVGVYYGSGIVNPSGPGDFQPYLGASGGDINSLTCAWGKPVIAYRNTADDSLWVARAYTVEEQYLGAFFKYPLDTLRTVGDFISVAPVDLSFGVAYFDENNGNLCYASHSDLFAP